MRSEGNPKSINTLIPFNKVQVQYTIQGYYYYMKTHKNDDPKCVIPKKPLSLKGTKKIIIFLGGPWPHSRIYPQEIIVHQGGDEGIQSWGVSLGGNQLYE